MKKFFAAMIALMLIIAAPALAVVKPNDDFYVLDNADVLSQDTEGMIVFSNDLLSADCGAQFVVVTVDSTGNESIDEYAYELFNEWEIGDKKAQNGFLLLLAIDDENYYYLPGTGLDYDLSAGRVRPIVDEYLEPYFAKGEYDEGVEKVFEQIFAKIAKACDSDVTVNDGIKAYEKWLKSGAEPETAPRAERNVSPRKKGGISPLFIILIVIAVLVLLGGRRRRRIRRRTTVVPPIVPPIVVKTARRPAHPRPRVMHRAAPPPPVAKMPKIRVTMDKSPRVGGGVSHRRTGGGGRTMGGGAGRSLFSGGGSRGGGRSSFGGGRSGFGGGRSGGGGGSRGGGGGRGR